VVAEPNWPRADRATAVACEECRREWTDPLERWHVYLTADDPAVTVAYCPRCAEREFGQGIDPNA
jgi:hypothetical protein